jgi:Mg2+-importing ATPase
VGSILTELVFLFSIRTRLPFFRASRPSWVVVVLTVVAAAVTILLPYTAFGQNVFSFTPPSPVSLAIILGLVAAFFVSAELVKLAYYRFTS